MIQMVTHTVFVPFQQHREVLQCVSFLRNWPRLIKYDSLNIEVNGKKILQNVEYR